MAYCYLQPSPIPLEGSCPVVEGDSEQAVGHRLVSYGDGSGYLVASIREIIGGKDQIILAVGWVGPVFEAPPVGEDGAHGHLGAAPAGREDCAGVGLPGGEAGGLESAAAKAAMIVPLMRAGATA
jgi:hypothetical protein